MILRWFIWIVSETEICYAIFNDARQLFSGSSFQRTFSIELFAFASNFICFFYFQRNGKVMFIFFNQHVHIWMFNTKVNALSLKLPSYETLVRFSLFYFVKLNTHTQRKKTHLFHLTVIGCSMHRHVKGSASVHTFATIGSFTFRSY